MVLNSESSIYKGDSSKCSMRSRQVFPCKENPKLSQEIFFFSFGCFNNNTQCLLQKGAWANGSHDICKHETHLNLC